MPAPPAEPAADRRRAAYQYAVVRLVPDAERGERVNVGVILFRRPEGYLKARVVVDPTLLAALAPQLDLAQVRAHLDVLVGVAAGDATAGPLAASDPSARFGWLVAPASTVIQVSAVHTGICPPGTAALDACLDRLVERLVARRPRRPGGARPGPPG